MTRAVRIQCWQRFSDIPLSREQWNAMAQRNETHSVFQTHEWHQAWWDTFGDQHRLFFLTAHDQSDAVVGFAPLMLQDSRGTPQLLFIGDTNADYLDFVIPEGKESILPAFLDYIRWHMAQWARLTLNNIPATSSTPGLIDHYCAHHGLRRWTQESICPTLRIAGNREAALGLINKYSVKRPYRYFQRLGTLQFRRLTDHEEAQRLLPAFFAQHVERRRMAGSSSLFCDTRRQRFYSSLLERMLPQGWVHFSVVELDGKPLAFHFGFDFDEHIIWYKPSFDPASAKHSPGLLLIRFLIDDAITHDKAEFDFTIGDEAFKDRFANIWRGNVSLFVFSDPWRYYANRLERHLVKQAKRIVQFFHRHLSRHPAR